VKLDGRRVAIVKSKLETLATLHKLYEEYPDYKQRELGRAALGERWWTFGGGSQED